MRDSGDRSGCDDWEVLTTCEKFQWTINNGEKYLKPESRDFGINDDEESVCGMAPYRCDSW